MTAKDIEHDLKNFIGGGSFVTPGKLAQYLGQKNTSRVRERYMQNAFRLEGTKSYFVPDIAKSIYLQGSWKE